MAVKTEYNDWAYKKAIGLARDAGYDLSDTLQDDAPIIAIAAALREANDEGRRSAVGAGCQCDQEYGDSPCPVHGEDE